MVRCCLSISSVVKGMKPWADSGKKKLILTGLVVLFLSGAIGSPLCLGNEREQDIKAAKRDAQEKQIQFNADYTTLIRYPAAYDGDISYSIPSCVTAINEEAFNGCTGLEKIQIPTSVTALEKSVFAGCVNLKEITIPNSVTSIGAAAFQDCSKLDLVEIPPGVTVMHCSTFSGCSELRALKLSPNTTIIGEDAFRGCHYLSFLILPGSLKRIEPGAFKDCSFEEDDFEKIHVLSRESSAEK